MGHRNLLNLLKNEGILIYGDFTLRSGETSKYYCDVKKALGAPKILTLIVKELCKIVPGEVTCIAGSGYGGITLSSLVAHTLGLPLVLMRDKMKDHGTKQLIDAYVPTKNDVVCIIDDVYTTGSSIKDTKVKLRITKCKLTKPVVVLNRSKSKSIYFLLKSSDLNS